MAAAFSLLTGLSTTLGRVDRGLINATAERYTTGAVVFAVCLLLYLVIHWQRIRTRRLLNILSTIWIVALGLYGSIMLGYQRFYLFHYGIQYHQKMVALNGIRNDCFDPNYSGFLYPDLHRHLHHDPPPEGSVDLIRAPYTEHDRSAFLSGYFTCGRFCENSRSFLQRSRRQTEQSDPLW